MCGLVGAAGTLNKKEVDAFNDLLHFNTVRGHHSTGIASVRRGSPAMVDVFKRVGIAYDLMGHKRYEDIVGLGRQLLMGHGRYATIGEINNVNAHPFSFEHIVGAHNGTIPTIHREKLNNFKDFGTDSEALLNQINNVGVTDTIPTIMGAWALTWYDRRDNTINFLRNKDRTLFWTMSRDETALFWASEVGILEAALSRRGVEYDTVYSFDEDVWFKWEIPTKYNDKFTFDPVEQEVKAKETVVQVFSGGRQAVDNSTPFRVSASDSGKNSDVRWATVNTDITEVPTISNKDGHWISELEYTRRTGCSCAACDNIVAWDDIVAERTKIRFVEDNAFFCEDCGEDPFMERWLRSELIGWSVN